MAASATPPLINRQMQLRWSTHQGTIISNFDTLLKNESFVDVTLSAEGKQLKAHKILLSACSPYFEEIFKQIQGEKYPIVFLKDVKFDELQSLVHFMYHGEVKVSQDELPSLLNVAKGLRVRGLSSDQPVQTPTSSTKSIPLEALINSRSNSGKPPIASSTSSFQTIIPQTSLNFRNNSSQETPIKIVNCNSLATPLNTNSSALQLVKTSPESYIFNKPIMKTTPAYSAPVSSLLRIPVLQFDKGSSSPQERYILATPVSAANGTTRNVLPKRQIRTVTSSSNEMFKTRPIILGSNKSTVTTFAAPPVRKEDDGPPILFPEIELPEIKPRFQFVNTKSHSELVELEEEEVEMMTNGNENSENASPPDLTASSWSFVEPGKLADMKTGPPEIVSTSSASARVRACQIRLAARLRTKRLQLHQKRNRYAAHNKSLMYQCKLCLRLYQRKGSLVRHEKYECNKPPQFQCDYCGVRMRHTFHKNIHEKSCMRKYRRAFPKVEKHITARQKFKKE